MIHLFNIFSNYLSIQTGITNILHNFPRYLILFPIYHGVQITVAATGGGGVRGGKMPPPQFWFAHLQLSEK